MGRYISPATALFLVFFGLTALVWMLRGWKLLSFLPSSVIWVLLLLTIGAGIVSGLQATR
ncbi:hypothetical protein BST81_15565 [Leptolyngbya sp. 'hensonii']|uniref:hypothetical protein n=1 Tax=Leptolyngbya sp. 'hensonii' TaxID=1922337 RepID=UPI00094FD586|nr:hypothetical protein [Leptolyngbya sp. 'hensonii']OLP17735.1 hypothetical protein BST81_15565 [Leptolyngbya sp. 'hensonii']